MMKPKKRQCIKHILDFYIGNGDGVVTTLNKAILEYSIKLVQIQCKMTWMLSMKILQLV